LRFLRVSGLNPINLSGYKIGYAVLKSTHSLYGAVSKVVFEKFPPADKTNPKINISGMVMTFSLVLQKKTRCFTAVKAAKHLVFLFYARPWGG
jgi:hypothetical protein